MNIDWLMIDRSDNDVGLPYVLLITQ